MSDNDYHFDYKGKLRSGSLEPDLPEMLEHRESLDAKIYKKLLEAQPMLRGTGFIVIDPAQPVFSGEEHKELETAIAEAGNLSYQSRAGVAIVYAPIQILRPSRPVANAQPSDIMKQIGGLAGKPVAITDGGETK